MRFIESGTLKICKECKKTYIPTTYLGRPYGENSKKWRERKFCSKSCGSSFTGRGQHKTLGKHWKMPLGFRRGWKHNAEGKLKISMVSKNLWKSDEYRKKVLGRRYMSSLEIKFLNYTKTNNLPYKFVGNGDFWIDNCNPDFINTNGEKVAIEVYCKQHKERLKNMTIEEWKTKRNSIFNRHGWRLLFFDAVDLNNENSVVSQIERGGYY